MEEEKVINEGGINGSADGTMTTIVLVYWLKLSISTSLRKGRSEDDHFRATNFPKYASANLRPIALCPAESKWILSPLCCKS